MDISDIHIVGQWRATCNLSTIWQRWGHAARDRMLQGTIILFAEKDYFDEVREEKHQRQEARKRKAKKKLTAHMLPPASKRRACTSSNGLPVMPHPATCLEDAAEAGGHLDVESSREESESDGGEHNVVMATEDVADSGGNGAGEVSSPSKKELQEMMRPKADRKPLRARKKRKELDPAMDFLINAHLRPGFHCCRKVFDLHFDNNAIGEKFPPHYIIVIIPYNRC